MGRLNVARVVVALHLPCWGLYAATIVNGGFETGDLTGWTLSGNTDFVDVGSFFPHSGTYALEAGPVGSLGFISQTLTTVPGAPYLLSLWLANDCGSSLTCTEPNAFQVSWGNQLVYSLNDLPTMDYTQLLFPLTATGSTTDLTLSFRQDQFSFYVDDISVQAVPEPSGLVLVGMPGLILVGWARPRLGKRFLSRISNDYSRRSEHFTVTDFRKHRRGLISQCRVARNLSRSSTNENA